MSVEGQCGFCPRWFSPSPTRRIPRHTYLRGTDLFVCSGSDKAPRSVRTVSTAKAG